MNVLLSKLHLAKLSNLMPCINKLYLLLHVVDANSERGSHCLKATPPHAMCTECFNRMTLADHSVKNGLALTYGITHPAQQRADSMMTSSNGNIFRVTGHLCGEFTGPHTKTSDAELWCFSLICARIKGWINNGEAGDLRRNRVHYDVIVMWAETILNWDGYTWHWRIYIVFVLFFCWFFMKETCISENIMYSAKIAIVDELWQIPI